MQISNFFKILNRKIEKYDKLTSNPFTIPQPITLIWVETEEKGNQKDDKPIDTL